MGTLQDVQDRIFPAPQVILDRVCICAAASDRKSFRQQPGHRTLPSHFLRSGAYGRFLKTQNARTGATTLFYDEPREPWVSKTKVVLRAGDEHGLVPSDVLGASELLNESRLTLFELAFDFPEQAGLNTGFVMEHVLFGKSRWAKRKSGIVWFGSRRSSKFVRAYAKRELHVFRIELQFNAGWLRRHKINDCFDFHRIPELVMRRHIWFCELNWAAVIRRIRRSVPNVPLALRNLQWERDRLHATLGFLRGELRFTNTYRFLLTLPHFNDPVMRALEVWAGQWPKRPFRLSKKQNTNAREER